MIITVYLLSSQMKLIIAYPLSKRIKTKNDPKAAPENKVVQYTADIIVEIKN
jgi:hypothetical protein